MGGIKPDIASTKELLVSFSTWGSSMAQTSTVDLFGMYNIMKRG